jgi:hypothetical protein
MLTVVVLNAMAPLASPTNISSGWKSLPGTNALGYFASSSVTMKNVLKYWLQTKDEMSKYVKRFNAIDKDKRGYITVTDLTKNMNVS